MNSRRGVLQGASKAGKAGSKKGAELVKPQVRDLTTSFHVTPLVLFTEESWTPPAGFDDMAEAEQVRALLKNPNNIVVGIGNLSLNHIAAFSREFGATAPQRIMQIFALEAYESGVPTSIVQDPSTGEYHTPYGVLRGTSQENAIKVLGFLFTTYGRIVAVDPNDEFGYTFQAIDDPSEYLSLLDQTFFSMVDPFDSQSMFMHILRASNLFDPSKLKMTDEEQKLAEEEGNTDPKAKSSTKRVSKDEPPS